MPTKRKVRTRKRWSASVSPVCWRFLLDASTASDIDTWEHFLLMCNHYSAVTNYRASDVWHKYRDEVLAEWLKASPGRRPTCWWHFEAKEARRVIQGQKPLSDHVGELGIPAFRFRLERHREPALVEAQAAYLKRHGLLERGEARRLTAADYEPEELLV